MNDREEESKDAIDEKFSRILPIIKLPNGYYEYDLYEPIGDTFNEFYEPEISKSELEAILEAEKWETCYKELETRWKEENEDVTFLDEKFCYKLPDIKLPKGYYLFDLYEPIENIVNEFYDRLSEAQVKAILEEIEKTEYDIAYEYFDFEDSENWIEELGDYDLMKYYCDLEEQEPIKPKNKYSEGCEWYMGKLYINTNELGGYDPDDFYALDDDVIPCLSKKDNVEFEKEIEATYEKFWEEVNNAPISNELHLIVVDKCKTQLISKNNKIVKLCEILVKYDTYNANLILLGKDSEIVDYYIGASDIIHIKNVHIYRYKEVIQIFPRKNSTLKVIRAKLDKDLMVVQEDVLEITLDVRTQDIVTILVKKFRDKFIEIQHLKNWYEFFVHKPVEDTFDEFYEDEIHEILETPCKEDGYEETELDKIDIQCKNMERGFCNTCVHNIMVKMGATKSYLYQGGLFDKCSSLLFCWDYIPEKEEHCDHLKKFLRKKYNLDWVLKAKIDKTDYDNVICVFTQAEKLTIRRRKQNKAIVNYRSMSDLDGVLDNLRTDTVILKYEDRNLNVYRRKYRKLEGPECIQYLHEYVPLHLPQITYVLSDILTRKIFTDNQTINIMDFGSGPATVPLALCRVKENEIKDRKFKITTVEASKTFNNMIQDFKFKNKNKSVHIINNIECDAIDFINKMEFKGGYNWIIIANSITVLGEDRSFEEVNIILNKFIFNILNCNKKLGDSNKILITFIESGAQDKFDFKFIDYLSEIENIGFTNLEIIDSIQKNTRIEAKWILDCDFYKTGNNLYKANINSKSLLLELKK